MSLPVALLAVRAFIVLFLALCEPDLELHSALDPMEVQGHEGVTLALDGADKAVQFLPVQ